jgi:putative flippase GtrA
MIQKVLKKYHFLFDLLFKAKNESTAIQLFRYFFVGGVAFLADFCTLFFLTEYVHVYYMISAGISFLVGLIINYMLSTKWVFVNRSVKSKYLEFLLFSLIGAVGLGLNELFIWVLTDVLSLFYLLSKIITTVIVYFWNFFARKFLLFNKV